MSDDAVPAEDITDLLRFMALERVSSQWAGFLSVLSQALADQLTPVEYRHFLSRLGERFASEQPLAAVEGLPALEQAINAKWQSMHWGYAQLSDRGGALVVVHRACPLPAALQADASVVGGFLEGVYRVWLAAAGAPSELTLTQLPDAGVPMHMAFELKAA